MSERDYDLDVLDVLLRELEERYTRPEIPPCSVCGGELTMAASGPGPAVFACSGMEADPDNPDRVRYKEGRSPADDHYSESRIEVHDLGDSRVLALIEEVRRLRTAPEPDSEGLVELASEACETLENIAAHVEDYVENETIDQPKFAAEVVTEVVDYYDRLRALRDRLQADQGAGDAE